MLIWLFVLFLLMISFTFRKNVLIIYIIDKITTIPFISVSNKKLYIYNLTSWVRRILYIPIFKKLMPNFFLQNYLSVSGSDLFSRAKTTKVNFDKLLDIMKNFFLNLSLQYANFFSKFISTLFYSYINWIFTFDLFALNTTSSLIQSVLCFI